MSTGSVPNRLRELRLAQGWTQAQVAERLARLAWARREGDPGVNADMVAKWERGVKRPSPRYRKLLAALFKVSIDQLGLPACGRGKPDTGPGDQSLVAVVDQAVELLQQLGDAGQAVRPRVLAALTDDVLNRRTMLDILDTPPAASAVPEVAELDALADRYQSAHATAAPAPLMTAVTAHLRMVGDALRQHLTAGTRQQLLRNRARVAILAGQLAADDLDNITAARAHYAQALDDAYELDDHQVAAIVHGHTARLAIMTGQHSAALGHLDAAARIQSSDTAISSWLALIEATAHAAGGNHAAANEALDRVETARRNSSRSVGPRWFIENHPTRHTATTGRVLLAAGDYPDARRTLAKAIDQLDKHATANRRPLILCLLDQAEAEICLGSLDAGAALITRAAKLLLLAPYAAGTARIHVLRDLLAEKRPKTPMLRDLDDQLAALPRVS